MNDRLTKAARAALLLITTGVALCGALVVYRCSGGA